MNPLSFLKKNKLSSNTRLNIINGVFYSIGLNLLNPYYAKFTYRLGGTAMHVALQSSLPAVFSIFALIPGAILIDSLGKKQLTTSIFMLLNKIFFLLIAFVPFLPDNYPKPIIFITLLALMNLPGSIYLSGYNSSLGDIFTPRERGRATALRNRYSDIAKIIVTFASGFLMNMQKTDSEIIILYQIYFFIAFIVGLFETYTFMKLDFSPNLIDPKVEKTKKTTETKIFNIDTFKDSLSYTFKSRRFRPFLIASTIFYIGWPLGWPLFSIFMIENLGGTEGWIAANSISLAISSIIAATLWMNFAEKKSPEFAVIIATFLMAITPWLYILSSSLFELLLYHILIGVSVTGTVLLFLNIMLERTPSQNRTTIISIHATIVAVLQAIVPLLSISLMNALGIKKAMVVVGILRMIGCIAFIFMYYSTQKNKKIKSQ